MNHRSHQSTSEMDCYTEQDTGCPGQRMESVMARGHCFQIPSLELSFFHEMILQILFGLLPFEFYSVPKYLESLGNCLEDDHSRVL